MTTWTERDQPVLAWLAEALDPLDVYDVSGPEPIAAALGMPVEAVGAALRNLDRGGYIRGIRVDQYDYPLRISEVTPEGLRAAGSWPSPDSVVEALVRELTARADRATTEDERGFWRKLAEGLGGGARDVAVGVITNSIGSF